MEFNYKAQTFCIESLKLYENAIISDLLTKSDIIQNAINENSFLLIFVRFFSIGT